MNVGNPASFPTIPKDMDGEAIRRFWRNPIKYLSTPRASADQMDSAPRRPSHARGVAPATANGLQTPNR